MGIAPGRRGLPLSVCLLLFATLSQNTPLSTVSHHSIFRRAHFRGRVVPALVQLAEQFGEKSHANQLVQQLINAGKVPASCVQMLWKWKKESQTWEARMTRHVGRRVTHKHPKTAATRKVFTAQQPRPFHNSTLEKHAPVAALTSGSAASVADALARRLKAIAQEDTTCADDIRAALAPVDSGKMAASKVHTIIEALWDAASSLCQRSTLPETGGFAHHPGAPWTSQFLTATGALFGEGRSALAEAWLQHLLQRSEQGAGTVGPQSAPFCFAVASGCASSSPQSAPPSARLVQA